MDSDYGTSRAAGLIAHGLPVPDVPTFVGGTLSSANLNVTMRD
jgi:hypothetical protein